MRALCHSDRKTEPPMPLVHLVIGLALVEFFLFVWAVARARARFGVAAPATTGHEVFARYVNAYAASALGAVFVIGRALYCTGYVRSAQGRHLGFMLSALPNVTLLVGAIIGALVALGARG